MSNLYAFLHPELPEQKEVVFSRFKDENGNVVPFVIRPITSEVNKALIKKCTLTTKDRSGVNRKIDTDRYQAEIVLAGTVQPDFSDAQICEAYGVVSPELVIGKMLLAGEFMTLVNEILALSGLDEESEEAAVAEAKN